MQLTADDFLALLGTDLLPFDALTLVEEPPTTLVPDGVIVVFPAVSPLPAGCDALVIEGTQSKSMFVSVSREVFEYLNGAL
jgi:hypothetical protein